MGNGKCLHISHTGYAFLPSFCAKRYLYLKKILFVPKITKNPFSISKFPEDNNVIVELMSDYCLVNDKDTRNMQLRGTFKDGLHQLQAPIDGLNLFITPVHFSCHLCLLINFVMYANISNCTFDKSSIGFTSIISVNNSILSVFSLPCTILNINKVNVSIRHRRLGHPCVKTLKNIFTKLKYIVNFANFTFCKDCQYGKHHQSHFTLSNSRAIQPLNSFIVTCKVQHL